jgi:hypothetical protein
MHVKRQEKLLRAYLYMHHFGQLPITAI